MNTLETAHYFLGLKNSRDIKFERPDSLIQLAQAVADAHRQFHIIELDCDSSMSAKHESRLWLAKHAAGEEIKKGDE